MPELSTIIANIDTIFEDIGKHRTDPVALLIDANKLLSLNYKLGDLYVSAKQNADLSELNAKATLDGAFTKQRSEKNSVEDSKAFARIQACPKYVETIEKQFIVDTLKTKRQDITDKVSVIQSYCSALRDQYKQEGRQEKL